MPLTNYYYSGQGSVLIAKRNVNGVPQGFLRFGNVPELSLDIEITNFEHKESESGSRLIDLVIVKEKKGKFSFKAESLNLDNLALGFWGETATVAGATITDEVIAIPTGGLDRKYTLAHPKVSAVTVTNDGGTTTYVLNTDYTLDANNGAVTPLSTGAIAAGANIKVDYTYGSYTKMDAFTNSVAPERWLRFEGLNTIDGSRVIIDLFRAQFDPLTGYGLINEDLGSVDIKGSVLADTTRTSGSLFFSQRNFT